MTDLGSVGATCTNRTHRVFMCALSSQFFFQCVPTNYENLYHSISPQTQAGILTGLKHGHVVEMLGFYKWDQAYCLAMEHMEGGDLCEDILRRVFYSEACARRVSRAGNMAAL